MSSSSQQIISSSSSDDKRAVQVSSSSSIEIVEKKSTENQVKKSKGSSSPAPSKKAKVAKKAKGKRKGKRAEHDDSLVHFGTDEAQRIFSVEPEGGVVPVSALTKHFHMTTIKYLVSEEHDRVVAVDKSYFEVKPGMGYIIEGVPRGNNICYLCHKEFVEGSTKTCRHHAADWGTISVEKKDRVKNPETGKWDNVKVMKDVPGWPCCQSEELNAKGCQKEKAHVMTYNSDGTLIHDKSKKSKSNKATKSKKIREPSSDEVSLQSVETSD
eukprot:TRINITY_DN233_c0_g1_i1.p1 TRINITY_DN233_c0_g1~~TRINITY_DN233_c0_g1_i1.p1  ORF type:complete len:269 (+),score=52.91 TRINITY_DN233_c0_g1_i1:641-1447(+)